jgi:hypothetical protein
VNGHARIIENDLRGPSNRPGHDWPDGPGRFGPWPGLVLTNDPLRNVTVLE